MLQCQVLWLIKHGLTNNFNVFYNNDRAKKDIVDLQPGDDDVSQDYDAVEDTDSGLSLVISPFSLYHELLMDVKV